MKNKEYTNLLIHEKSPYLIQHAHNPVNWFPWGTEAFVKAKNEDKLILISIGYSACHWCHVMEKQSFENEDVAEIMNEYYVCIKVDREERPDVDQIYMEAVQMMNGNGGWPLNCFALPDGRPVFGGTYFRPQQWKQLLEGLSLSYKKEKYKFTQVAEDLTKNLIYSENIAFDINERDHSFEDLQSIVHPWKLKFDQEHGGNKGAPKFPMPNSLQFLLDYSYYSKDESIKNHILLTLNKMANGGIYDQIGGGFARYSVDQYWRVPHFEKMLYDNAQLVRLYSMAYQYFRKPEFKNIVYQSLNFIEREMTSKEGAFFSSLDADSEGVEGKYYAWEKQEIEQILGPDAQIYSDFYTITASGNWEDSKNILFREKNEIEIADKFKMSVNALLEKIEKCNFIVLKERENKIRPALDDKILTSWNSLMLTSYIMAYRTFNEPKFLDTALKNAEFIEQNMIEEDFKLRRNYKDGEKGLIYGFLDDYAFTVESFIQLYQATFDQKWIDLAKNLLDFAILHFYDHETGIFFYTSDFDEKLILRTKEIHDNVIPSSNSAMAKNLFLLGKYYYDEKYTEIASQMLCKVKDEIKRSGIYYSNWASLLSWHIYHPFEIAITGPDAIKMRQIFDQNYFPFAIYAGCTEASDLPILANRYNNNSSLIYICRDKTCLKPTSSISEAIQFISKNYPEPDKN